MLKPIIITSGEPAGIGPDIILQILKQSFSVPIVIAGDPTLFRDRAKQLNLTDIHLPYFDIHKTPPPFSMLPIPLNVSSLPGKLNVANAKSVVLMIQTATTMCIDNIFSALVTAPVNKAIINEAGIPFVGHTEYIAALTKTVRPVMMMTNNHYRIALLTTHIPLSSVAKQVTKANLTQCIQIIHKDLTRRFSIQNPRIVVCGLNPHAGENDYLGTEESTIIKPTLSTFRQQGFDIKGPVPADTAFIPANSHHADVILTMYHDQGLPIIKALDFEHTVNVTLGLPIIRTSVDHGTALSLAGTGKANATSLISAIRLATRLAQKNNYDYAQPQTT